MSGPGESLPCAHSIWRAVLPFTPQGLGQVGLSAKQLWPSVNYLLLEEGLCPALAVGLDAANVVGRGSLQDLQKLLQGRLQRGECGVKQGLERLCQTPPAALPAPKPGSSWACHDYWRLLLRVPKAHSS